MKEEAEPAEGGGPFPRPAFDVERVQGLIQKYFRVYEVEQDIKGIPRGQIAAYYVQTDAETFTQKFETLREEIRGLDPSLLVILQHRLGEDVILVAQKPPISEKGPTVNIVLLVLTIITTTLGGAIFYQPYAGAEDLVTLFGFDASFLHPRIIFFGFVTFSVPLILILGIHELGHYYVAKRHRVKTSLPYFIPVPPIVPIGTFGAFISMREPIPDRKALFDIGAAGPVFGFLLAVPVVILGMVLTAFYAVPIPADPEVRASLESPLDEDVFGYNASRSPDDAYTYTGPVDEGNRRVSERIEVNLTRLYGADVPGQNWTLRFTGLHFDEDQTIEVSVRYHAPPGSPFGGDFTPDEEDETAFVANLQRDVAADDPNATYTFPVAANATQLSAELRWREPEPGYFRLGDSLLFFGLQYVVDQVLPSDDRVFTHPTGIAGWVGLLVTGFNLLPAGQLDGGHVARAVLGERMRWASYASVLLMFLLSFRFTGWIIMAILIVFLGLQHPPPLNDKSPLDARRRTIAVIILLLLLVTFVPFPFVPA